MNRTTFLAAAALLFPGAMLLAGAPAGAESAPMMSTQGGPDTYGYRFIDNINETAGPSYTELWQDISTSGTQLAIQGDDVATSFTCPILIRFYGQNWGTDTSGAAIPVVSPLVGVTSNCFLRLLGPGQAMTAYPYGDGALPRTDANNMASGLIAVFLDDMDGRGANDSAQWEVIGTAPSRRLVVQWTNWGWFGGGQQTDMTIQVQITESDGTQESEIYFSYQGVTDDRESGNSATIGIQAVNATSFLQYSFNTANSTTPDPTSGDPRVLRFFAGQPPNPPTGLLQAADAGGPARPVNFISDATVYFRGIVTDPDTGDRVGLEVEILPSATPFQTDITGDTARTAAADLVPNGGEPEALYTFTGSPFGSGDYQWRARSFDANGNTSPWATYDPAGTHFRVDLDASTIPEPVYPLQDKKASAGGDRFVWLLSEDVGPPGPIRYEFQAHDNASFVNPLAADTVVDEAQGILVLPLSPDPFFWRVRATDRAGNSSPWSPTIRFYTKGDDGIDHAAGDAPDGSAGCSAGHAQASNGVLFLFRLLVLTGARATLAFSRYSAEVTMEGRRHARPVSRPGSVSRPWNRA
ncbi:MAG: hypothetical protein HY716_12610 [Planctomycetes bacterium]|nr:hypothetical protein [Planctomycetota bacterium]